MVDEGQPRGDRLGHQGPDQGYALRLARQFEGKLTLTAGEHEKDALAGAVAVALKRASLFGRAPVIHDLTVALTVWGFLDEEPPKELVDLRKHLFEEVWHPHHYAELRRIVDLVPEATAAADPATSPRPTAPTGAASSATSRSPPLSLCVPRPCRQRSVAPPRSLRRS